MRRTLLYIIIILFVYLGGCKKNSSTNVTPNKVAYTSPKMNGNWIWIGTGYCSAYPVPDVFVQFSVSVENDSDVLVGGTVLHLTYADPISHAATFYHNDDPSSYRLNDESLYYNPTNNTMELSSQANTSFGGIGENISTSGYIPNPSLKIYVPNIAGTKSLSGVGYDTSRYRLPNPDSTYNLSVNMKFTIINDSTITFDKDILNFGDNTLHYRSTDNIGHTVTFQTFHSQYYMISTLTYNYTTGKIVFEQRSLYPDNSKYLVLR